MGKKEINWDNNEELAELRWRLYIPISCVLSFVFGSTYALSAFGLSVKDYDEALLPPFISALSIQSFVAAITLAAGAYFLDEYPEKLRAFTSCGALLMLLQSAAAMGIKAHSPFFMTLALAIEGLGIGVLYLVGVEHAARWMPDRPGLAMGITMGSMGMGQIFGARCFDLLSVKFGSVVWGFHATSFIFCIPTMIAAQFLMYPPMGWDPRSPEELALLGDGQVSNETGVKLGWRLLVQWHFYCLLWIVAMGAGPAFGVMSGFTTVLNRLFGMDAATASSWFAIMSFISMITRFLTGVLADLCGWGTGYFWSGGKNLAIVIFSLQTVAFAVIGPLHHAGYYGGAMICISITFMSFAAAGVIAAIMCRQMFAPRNAGVVFGIAAGLTDGLATMIFGVYMSNIEKVAETSAAPSEVFLSYFSSSVMWSLIGVACSLLMNRCDAAFEEVLENGDIRVFIEETDPKGLAIAVGKLENGCYGAAKSPYNHGHAYL